MEPVLRTKSSVINKIKCCRCGEIIEPGTQYYALRSGYEWHRKCPTESELGQRDLVKDLRVEISELKKQLQDANKDNNTLVERLSVVTDKNRQLKSANWALTIALDKERTNNY